MSNDARERLDAQARAWRVALDNAVDVVETPSSLIAFGTRDGQSVALKVVTRRGDEWASGAVARAFDGHGVVRVYESIDGAALLERLTPGHSLVRMSLGGLDDEAVDVIADVIQRMSAAPQPVKCAAVHELATAFEQYAASGANEIPIDLVREAQARFRALAASQRGARLLHGDLHHHNVLFDAARGWTAIDPKGLVGEVEYEIGAALRNPIEQLDRFASPDAVERRIGRFSKTLRIDEERTLDWTFAQAVLSAIWSAEDGAIVDARSPIVRFASALRALLR